jgi:hypothetical protein
MSDETDSCSDLELEIERVRTGWTRHGVVCVPAQWEPGSGWAQCVACREWLESSRRVQLEVPSTT